MTSMVNLANVATDRPNTYWADFPETYRDEQVSIIMQWIAVGDSGVVIGGSGAGKSNLVGFLAGRPDVLARHLPNQAANSCFLYLDANSLPLITTANFYRGLLYTLQDATTTLGPELTTEIAAIVAKLPTGDDPIGLYFALQRVHTLLIRRAGKKVVWLIDRFDEACKRLEAGALSSLRSLRDQFKGNLSYLVFTRFPLARLRNPAEFDEFHEIMVTHTCWVGPMVERDARWIAHQMAERYQCSFTESAITQIIEVTGGLPAFTKAACMALATGQLSPSGSAQVWTEQLLVQPVFQRNCQEIWGDCTAVERIALTDFATWGENMGTDTETLAYLIKAGLLTQAAPRAQLHIFSPIFALFVKQQRTPVSSGITLDTRTGHILRDGFPLQAEFTQLETCLLAYFIAHAGQLCEKNTLIAHVWPDEKVVDGIRDDSLAQLIKRLRDKIEVAGAKQSVIQNVRGRGYRFVQG
jgi:DNA-binding winged helix-turn-helix (wHTH) protein